MRLCVQFTGYRSDSAFTNELPVVIDAGSNSNRLHALSWSPDGSKIATGKQNDIRVFNTKTGKTLCVYSSFSDKPIDITWSPDGSRIAAYGVYGGRNNKSTEVHVFDTLNGKQLYVCKAHTMGKLAFTRVSWSPDGSKIALGGYPDLHSRRTINVIDAQHGNTLHDLAENVWDIVWSPDGSKIASNNEHEVRIFRTRTAQLLCAYPCSKNTQWDTVAWSPDGAVVSVATDDKIVHFFNPERGKLLFTYTGYCVENTYRVDSISWSPDGSKVAICSDWYVHVLDFKNRKVVFKEYTNTKKAYSLKWSPDGRKLAAIAVGNLYVFDVESRRKVVEMSSNGLTLPVLWSPNGSKMAIYDGKVQITNMVI